MGNTNKILNDKIIAADLTISEGKAVEFIINNVDKVVFMSATQVAELCELSPTSITRIIQKLGYGKYSDFKKDIETLYREQISPKDMFDDYIENGIKSEVVQQSLQRDYDNLRAMEENLDEETIKQVAEKIASVRKVFVVGMFGSEVVARAIDYYLWRLGKEHETFMGVGSSKRIMFSDIRKDDVLIAISSQRILKEIMESVDFANDNGIITVTITDNITNPLANKADYVLVAPVKGKVFDYTHTATLALVDILCNMIANEMKGAVRETLREPLLPNSEKLFCI